MKKPLYYFTIDLVVEEHGLINPVDIAEKVHEEFGEDISPQQIIKYLGKPKLKERGVTMKQIFG
jgi:hypothetical protein